jgi:hypothetical protein
MEKNLNIARPEDWYEVTRQDVENQKGLNSLLQQVPVYFYG